MLKKEQREIEGEPGKKRGLLRLIELIDRDGGKFLKAGGLAFLGLIPYMAGLSLAVAARDPLLLLVAGLLGGLIAAPGICGVADTVLRSQRDEVGWWWWHSYKKAWKSNWKQVLLPGAVFGLIAGAEIYALYYVAVQEDPTRDFLLLMGAALLELGIFGYWLPMQACMELSGQALLRNCFILFLNHPIKSLLAALVQLLYIGLILIWFPLTLLFLLLFSAWLPLLGAYGILYPILNQHFGLEEAYAKLRQQRWERGEEQ